MKKSQRASRFLVAISVMTVAGCVSAARSPQTTTQPGLPTATPQQMEALFRARQDSARMRFTADDVRFMTDMIGHHSQALVMSNLAPGNGASGTIRTLAARIINAQKDEIALMEQWLRDRGQAVPQIHIDGIAMHGSHSMNMPGMLTQEQLQQLVAAKGSDFDRLFLQFMIQHHKGAVTMVHELFEKDGAGQDEQVFKLASDIQVDQITEIARMEGMLAAMGAGAR